MKNIHSSLLILSTSLLFCLSSHDSTAQWIYSLGITSQNSIPQLQRINLTTYEFFRMGVIEDTGDIAFAPDGTLYCVIYDKVFVLDTITSTYTEVFTLPNFRAGGMAIDYNGLMYFGGFNDISQSLEVATLNLASGTFRSIADFGPYNFSSVDDLDFYNGDLYIVGQLPPGYSKRAALFKVDTSGVNMHDTITTYDKWPGHALVSVNDSCGSHLLLSPTSSLINFFYPPLDAINPVTINPVDGLFLSAGASSRTSYLGSIPPLGIDSIDIRQTPCEAYTIVTVLIRKGRPPAVQYSLDGLTYQDSSTFTNVSPGIYQAFVRDDWGCSQMSDPFAVPDKAAFPVSWKELLLPVVKRMPPS